MTVYISNLSEDVWPFISAISQSQEREFEIQENANLADRDLFAFAGEDDVLFVCPKPISDEFLAYYTALFNPKRLQVLVPRVHTGEICGDILADKKVMAAILEAANGQKRLTVTSYATSPQFLGLVAQLRKKGLSVFTPEAPEEEDAWVVDFYGSKSGIRQLAAQANEREPDFKMAPGVICSGIGIAAKIAAHIYTTQKGVVVKTNKGHAGAGVLIYRPGDLSGDYPQLEQQILTTLKKNTYWEKFPIVVEEYIPVNQGVAGGIPNVEFRIWKTGRVEFFYSCGMRVTSEGVFKGIEIHDDVLSDRLNAQIIDTGFFVGEQYAAAGYRGHFEVDYIAGTNGKIYVTESNIRRTGGTHVQKTALALFGKDFARDVYTLSNNVYNMPGGKAVAFPTILTRLRSVLFDKKTGEGLIVVSEHILAQGSLGYIIFGKTKKRALEIERKMEESLG